MRRWMLRTFCGVVAALSLCLAYQSWHGGRTLGEESSAEAAPQPFPRGKATLLEPDAAVAIGDAVRVSHEEPVQGESTSSRRTSRSILVGDRYADPAEAAPTPRTAARPMPRRVHPQLDAEQPSSPQPHIGQQQPSALPAENPLGLPEDEAAMDRSEEDYRQADPLAAPLPGENTIDEQPVAAPPTALESLSDDEPIGPEQPGESAVPAELDPVPAEFDEAPAPPASADRLPSSGDMPRRELPGEEFSGEGPRGRKGSGGESAGDPADDPSPVRIEARSETRVDVPRQPGRAVVLPGSATAAEAALPPISLRWDVPSAVNRGEPIPCQLSVYNPSESPCGDVLVQVRIPAGCELLQSEPPLKADNGVLTWQVGSLSPSQTQMLRLSLRGDLQGAIKPTAVLTVTQAVAARVFVQEPKLDLAMQIAPQSLAGEVAMLEVQVSNPGTGVVPQAAVVVQLDSKLHHPKGSVLRYELGSLGGNETRRVRIPVIGLEPGQGVIRGSAFSGTLKVESQATIAIRKPALEVALDGPKLRFVDRPGTYTITLRNPDTVAVDNVQLSADVPREATLVQASRGGHYDPATGRVTWFLGRVEGEQSIQATLQLKAATPGEYRLAATAVGSPDVTATSEMSLRIQGFAAVEVEIADLEDPVELGSENTYQVHVHNRGTKAARDIQLAFLLPAELELIEVDGPTREEVSGQRILFGTIATLEPEQTYTYQIRVKCVQAGRAVVRAYYRSGDYEVPLQVEKVTRIYGD